MAQDTLDKQGNQVEYANKAGTLRYGRNLHDTDHIRNLSGVGGETLTSSLQLLQALAITPFVVGKDEDDPYSDPVEAINDAAEVTSSQAWEIVLIKPGIYTIPQFELPRYVLVLGFSRSVFDIGLSIFEGGPITFAPLGQGGTIRGIRFQNQAAGQPFLDIGPPQLSTRLLLEDCSFVSSDASAPLVRIAGASVTRKSLIEMNNCHFFSQAGNVPAVLDIGTYSEVSLNSGCVLENFSGANPIAVQMSGVGCIVEMYATFCKGRVVCEASSLLSLFQACRLSSVLAHALQIDAGAEVFAYGHQAIAGQVAGALDVEGAGELHYSALAGNTPGVLARLDGALTLTTQGELQVFDPTTPGDWAPAPDNMQDAIDQLAARVEALEP